MSSRPSFALSRPITRSISANRSLSGTLSSQQSKRRLTVSARTNKSAFRLVKDLQSRLENAADPSERYFMERYLRNELPCRGLHIPVVVGTVKKWAKDHQLSKRTCTSKDIAFDEQVLRAMFESPFSEDKIAATVYANAVMLPSGTLDVDRLTLFEELFAKDLLRPWSTVDSLCSRVFSKMIGADHDEVSYRISSWNSAKNVWKARSSLVAFVPHAKNEIFRDQIWESSSHVIKRPERFAKTAVGWILREVSKHDESFMLRFVERFKTHMSLEAVRNATKYCDTGTKKRVIQMVIKDNNSN